ncbi:bifunctional metallophosphatase/5'-nucleotidase [Paenibacillus mucilaginosus]|uniref:YunD n=1 Tax=Paenibacillus mucilaginosus (strain KNP414) TaxID=1036673 RepID=F8FF47_PAEMK|nr:bifunctional UDP-sugar hydrolase/5'-nucleotidase [Paenibacillus mucilaginosus]AEI39747.1 YunD [Paenibacillus mucilaginosus KNP414]MCG7217396.1 bifunctional metallophosphatase/5'-nucleotidase [Paenibacillus mucilaginosus]WDM29033.1 bifunctional metallophosphatase/5'-nucleotidase [Paenibacillus mucilaginosus]
MTDTTVRLRVLHTNDIHSHFEHMPSIASIIRTQRAEAGEDHTLTLDIGDHIDRVHPATEGTQGRANIAVLNAIGYDAVTLGNNEGLTLQPEILSRRYGEEAAFPVVLANMPEMASGTHPAWAVPYHIVVKSGIRVGLIGVTAPFAEFYNLLGWDVRDAVETVRRLSRELRPQVDVLVVMSHLGIRSDERMAAEIEGIDLILGGHTHHLIEEPLRIGRTAVCAAGKFGQYVGVVDLELDTASREIRKVESRVLASVTGEEAGDITSLIASYSEQASRVLDREVVRLDRPLSVDWYGESQLGNVLAAGLRRRTGAEIGLVNAGQLLGGPLQGSVTAGRLLELCPSPINPCRMKLTGAQLLRALEESLLPEYMDKPLYGYGFRGKVLGTLCVDGMTIDYDPQGEPGAKIHSVFVGTEPLEPARAYTVGTIDMFTFGIGYLSISEGTERKFYLPEFLRDVLLKQLHDKAVLQDSSRLRWIRLDARRSTS